MKKIYLLTILLLEIVLRTSAQITINRSDLGTFIGKRVISAQDTTNLNLISAGNPGPNQTWNLTGLSNDRQDTLQFSSPAQAVCSGNFPSANLAMNQGGNTTFIQENNSAIHLVGSCLAQFPGGNGIPFTIPRKVISFPLTYNTSFFGQTGFTLKAPSDFPPPDSFKIVSQSGYSVLVDGWGNLTTPSGTYPSLRKKSTTYQADSVFAYVGGVWVSSGDPKKDTLIEYEWYGQNNLFLASINQDGSGNITDAKYLMSIITGVEKAENTTAELSIFPNPSTGLVTIRSNSKTKGPIEIFNPMGTRVASVLRAGNETDLDFSALPAGCYYLRIHEGERIRSHKIIIE